MPHDVFLSYSKADQECALEVVDVLEAHAIRVWVAPRDVSPSADWAAEIIDAIAAARIMVLVFSAASNESAQVRREVERAVHKQLRILPLRIEDVMPSKSLEYFLSTQHWLDAFPPPRTAHYARLCAFLQADLRSAGSGGGGAGDWDVGRLRKIETELARFIGPVARHLVRRAAVGADASGSDELLRRLASELDSEQDQHRFLAACRELERPLRGGP